MPFSHNLAIRFSTANFSEEVCSQSIYGYNMTGQNGRGLLVAGASTSWRLLARWLKSRWPVRAPTQGPWTLSQGGFRRSRANQPLLLDQAPPLLHNPPHPTRPSQAQRPWPKGWSGRHRGSCWCEIKGYHHQGHFAGIKMQTKFCFHKKLTNVPPFTKIALTELIEKALSWNTKMWLRAGKKQYKYSSKVD